MDDVERFLDEYSNILMEEHREDILRYQSFLNKYLNVSKTSSRFGTHFISCSWAYDTATSGPDTCACYYVDSYKEKLMELVNWYKKNVNK